MHSEQLLSAVKETVESYEAGFREDALWESIEKLVDSFHQAAPLAAEGSQSGSSALPAAAPRAGRESPCTDERMCTPCFTGIGQCENPAPIAPSGDAGAAPCAEWQLVPRVPTYEMVRAGQESDGRSTGSLMESPDLIYRAMLAAAPGSEAIAKAIYDQWLLYEHEDGRYAVAVSGEAAFTGGDPKWHRLGPVTLIGRPAAWPIVKVTVKHGNVQTASLYAPGLPDGEYDLWLPESRAAREGALPDDKDAARYRAFFDWLPVCFRGEEYYSKAECDAAIDAKTGALK